MPYVSHDATPDRAFAVDGFRAPRNGWAVPYWTSPDALAAALDGVVGYDVSAVSVAVVGDAVVVTRDAEEETFTRGADGTFSGDGWAWLPAHPHVWRAGLGAHFCDTCDTHADFCSQDRA